MLERVWRKGNLVTLLMGMQTDTTTMENSREVPQKTKIRITIWSSNPTPGHIYRQNSKKIHAIPMFISALFTITKTCKQPRCPLIDKLINKMCTYLQWNTAAAAKSLQSCPTLCDPIDGSPPGSPVPGILQARTLEWVAITMEYYSTIKKNKIMTFTTTWMQPEIIMLSK